MYLGCFLFILDLFSVSLKNGGGNYSFSLSFITEKTERKIEDFVKCDSLPEEQIEKLTHPVWLPAYFRISQGFEPGDTLTMLYSGKEYPFEIAGFYQSGLFCYIGGGFKCVISDSDYELLKLIIRNTGYDGFYREFWFNSNDFEEHAYINRCTEVSSENIKDSTNVFTMKLEKQNTMQFMDMYMGILAFLSAVTLLAAVLMIMHRITNDIEDRMQQIGVLEALGHTAREISLTYVYEYAVCGGIGSVIGGLFAFLVSPAINKGIEVTIGRIVTAKTQFGMIILSVLLVTALVILFALFKAAQVKKYPPVTALRKGIKTHHFGTDILPLDKARGNINFTLSMKSFIKDFRSAASAAVCIIVSGVTILWCLNAVYFFKDGHKGMLETMCGYDITEEVQLMSGVDAYKVRDEIAAMPEVRKALVTYTAKNIPVKNSNYAGLAVVFRDFNDAENIPLTKGRYPEHDNEIMITVLRSITEDLDIGDSIVLEGNGIENKYVITGMTSSVMMNGMMLYLTDEGYRRTNFNDRPNEVHAYLADGVTENDFKEKLNDMYGASAKQAMSGEKGDGTLEDRIAAAADEKMAALVSNYGVSNADYAIVVGDKVITGNSRHFVVRDVFSWSGLAEMSMSQVANVVKIGTFIASILITIVVAVILGLIVSASIKRQRKSLGVMKGLGYSSKDLMTQMAMKIMPVAVISVGIAAVLSHYAYSGFWLMSNGVIGNINIPLTVIASIVLVVFCYAVTYFCAGKVKEISVTELMTE